MNLTVFFLISLCGSDKAYVERYNQGGNAALFHLKNMGHIIPKLFEVADINVEGTWYCQGNRTTKGSTRRC